MKLRRVVSALLALILMLGTLLLPQPASAETLGLNILDPTEVAASPSGFLGSGFTGVSNFDATSYNGATNAGTDSSAHNHIVRTNDQIGYDFNFNLLGGGGTNVVVTTVLSPAGAGKWILPTAGTCPGGASISPDGNTLTCTYGAVASGVQDLVASAQMLATATANGTHIEVSATVSDGPGNTVTRVGYSQSNGADAIVPDDIITSVQKAQLVKATSAIPNGTIAHIFNHNNTSINGYLVTYPILVREGDGSVGAAQLGVAPLPTSFSFNDTMVIPAGASVDACGVNGDGTVTINGDPYGVASGGARTTTNSVINSGAISCGALAGGVVPVTVAGADTSGTTYPTLDVNNTQVEAKSWVISGYIRMFVPDDGAVHSLSDHYVPDANFTGQTPSNGSCVLGDPGLQLCSSASLPIYAPALSGAGSKSIIQDVLGGTPHAFAGTANANGPALNPSQEFVAQIMQSNPSDSTTTGLANLQSAVSCDAIDTTKENVVAFDGTTGAASATQAVIVDGSSTATIAAIEYGGVGSSCADAYGTSANWYATIDMVTPANPNYFTKIKAVRVRYEIDAENPPTVPNQFLKFYVNQKTLATDNPGDIVADCNSTKADIFYGGAVTGTFNSGNCGQGQIFFSTYNIAKALRADISNATLFTVLGHANPGVDPGQEFVSYQQIDGHLNTVVQTNTFACDLIDTTKFTVADFHGTTNPATPIVGPVTFLTGSKPTINGGGNLTFSNPAVSVEYSTNPYTVGTSDNCQTGTWSTTEPSPASTITKIRIHWDLQINQSVMMLVNLKVNAGLNGFGSPSPDTLTNTMDASTLAAPAAITPATATAEVLTEVVKLTKQVAPANVAVGGSVTYTLNPVLFGPAGNSGTITIVDPLPAGLTYHAGSAVFTNIPPLASTWNPASGNPTPSTATAGGIQTLTFTVGTSTAAPGRFVALPSIQFQADTSIALGNGAVVNTGTVNDASDTSGTNHNGSATFNITGSGGLNVAKVVTLAPTGINTPITWELQYSNQSGADLPWTDFIDVLPFNGDTLGTHYNGALTFLSVTASDSVTFQYTNMPRNQINLDPNCATNGGSHGTSVVAGNPGAVCAAFANTAWYNGLGAPGGPATAAAVTAIRILGNNPLLHGTTTTHTIDISTTTSSNLPGDTYWNQYDLRTTNTLVAQAQASTAVPIPAAPFLSLVKSCISPANCLTAAQSPEQINPTSITDIVYGIQATNTGGHTLGSLVITDPIPNSGGGAPTFYMDFKVGSATTTYTGAFNAGMFSVSYSSDPLIGNASFTYTPISGGGGAPAGYDRNVTAVRWTMNGGNTLAAVGGANVGTVQFTATIR